MWSDHYPHKDNLISNLWVTIGHCLTTSVLPMLSQAAAHSVCHRSDAADARRWKHRWVSCLVWTFSRTGQSTVLLLVSTQELFPLLVPLTSFEARQSVRKLPERDKDVHTLKSITEPLELSDTPTVVLYYSKYQFVSDKTSTGNMSSTPSLIHHDVLDWAWRGFSSSCRVKRVWPGSDQRQEGSLVLVVCLGGLHSIIKDHSSLGQEENAGQAVKKHQTQMIKNKSISKISCPWVHLHTQTFCCFYCATAQLVSINV